jgi:hypothetical protein
MSILTPFPSCLVTPETSSFLANQHDRLLTQFNSSDVALRFLHSKLESTTSQNTMLEMKMEVMKSAEAAYEKRIAELESQMTPCLNSMLSAKIAQLEAEIAGHKETVELHKLCLSAQQMGALLEKLKSLEEENSRLKLQPSVLVNHSVEPTTQSSTVSIEEITPIKKPRKLYTRKYQCEKNNHTMPNGALTRSVYLFFVFGGLDLTQFREKIKDCSDEWKQQAEKDYDLIRSMYAAYKRKAQYKTFAYLEPRFAVNRKANGHPDIEYEPYEDYLREYENLSVSSNVEPDESKVEVMSDTDSDTSDTDSDSIYEEPTKRTSGRPRKHGDAGKYSNLPASQNGYVFTDNGSLTRNAYILTVFGGLSLEECREKIKDYPTQEAHKDYIDAREIYRKYMRKVAHKAMAIMEPKFAVNRKSNNYFDLPYKPYSKYLEDPMYLNDTVAPATTKKRKYTVESYTSMDVVPYFLTIFGGLTQLECWDKIKHLNGDELKDARADMATARREYQKIQMGETTKHNHYLHEIACNRQEHGLPPVTYMPYGKYKTECQSKAHNSNDENKSFAP